MNKKYLPIALLAFIVLILPGLYILWTGILLGRTYDIGVAMISMVMFIAGCIVIGAATE